MRAKRFHLCCLLLSFILTSCASSPHVWDRPPRLEPQGFDGHSDLQPSGTQRYHIDMEIDEEGAKVVQDLQPSGRQRYPIDLDTTLRLAAENNLEVAMAREIVHEAYARAVMEKERLLPVIGPDFQFRRLEGETQEVLGKFVNVDKQAMTVAARATVVWPLGETIFSILSSKRRYRSSELSYAALKEKKLLDTAVAYLEMVRWGQSVKIMERSVEISKSLVNELEESVRFGKSFKGDLLRAQTQLAHNNIELSMARMSSKEAAMKLAALLNLEPSIELYPAHDEVVPLRLVKEERLEDLITLALERRHEIKAGQEERKAVKNELSSAHWGPLIPNVITDATWGEFGPNLTDTDGQNTYSVGLGWKVGPGGLFDYGRMHLADARMKQAEINLAATVQKVKEEVASSYMLVNSQLERMKFADEGVKYAAESLTLNQERQRAGVGIPLEVIQAEDALTKVELDYLVSVITYNQSQFKLLQSTGDLLLGR